MPPIPKRIRRWLLHGGVLFAAVLAARVFGPRLAQALPAVLLEVAAERIAALTLYQIGALLLVGFVFWAWAMGWFGAEPATRPALLPRPSAERFRKGGRLR